jgi:hypothetical protein
MSKRELYHDVLDEGASAFEEAVLQKTVRTARRIRHTRIAARTALVAVIAAASAFQFWPRDEVVVATFPSPTPHVEASHTILRSQPFAGIIHSAAGSAERLLSSGDSIVVFKTGEADPGDVEKISDEQLLSFFKGRAVALVGRRGGGADLVFLEENGSGQGTP